MLNTLKNDERDHYEGNCNSDCIKCWRLTIASGRHEFAIRGEVDEEYGAWVALEILEQPLMAEVGFSFPWCAFFALGAGAAFGHRCFRRSLFVRSIWNVS